MRTLQHRLSLLALVVAATARPTLGQSAATPDNPKFLVWSEGVPCGVSPGPNDFLTHMVKFWIAVSRPADCSGRYLANYVKEHTRSSRWSNWNGVEEGGWRGSTLSRGCRGMASSPCRAAGATVGDDRRTEPDASPRS